MSEPSGFHGNKNMLNIVNAIVQDRQFYIETGTNVGHTFCYMARTYPQLQCFGCEPADPYYIKVSNRTQTFQNTKVMHCTSQKFMQMLNKKHSNIFEKPYIAWIDAHSKGFAWPLSQEMHFFTNRAKNAYILIDDFCVPNQPQFRCNKYGLQRYTFDYISKFFNPKVKLAVYYPKYFKTKEDRTLTGWIMLTTATNHVTTLSKFRNIITRAQ